jgi:hypothetical protein
VAYAETYIPCGSNSPVVAMTFVATHDWRLRPVNELPPTKTAQPVSRRAQARVVAVASVEILLIISIINESYCLSDTSPSRTHYRRDRSPGYRLCYVSERYVPRIGYLKERVRTSRYVVFRQHKAVADVLQCNDDDGIGNSSFFVL